MLRIIYSFNHSPKSYEIDPDAEFQPGQIGSLKLKNKKLLIGVCDGLNPIGIIDDVKCKKFRGVSITEEIIVPLTSTNHEMTINGIIFLNQNIKLQLNNSNVIASSFKSSIPVDLLPTNGVIVINAGVALSSNKFTVNYAYNIPNIPADDSTIGSNKVTIWDKAMIVETNMFDTTCEYSAYKNLYVDNGLLTNRINSPYCKVVGVVLKPPTAKTPVLQYLFDPEQKVEIGHNV